MLFEPPLSSSTRDKILRLSSDIFDILWIGSVSKQASEATKRKKRRQLNARRFLVEKKTKIALFEVSAATQTLIWERGCCDQSHGFAFFETEPCEQFTVMEQDHVLIHYKCDHKPSRDVEFVDMNTGLDLPLQVKKSSDGWQDFYGVVQRKIVTIDLENQTFTDTTVGIHRSSGRMWLVNAQGQITFLSMPEPSSFPSLRGTMMTSGGGTKHHVLHKETWHVLPCGRCFDGIGNRVLIEASDGKHIFLYNLESLETEVSISIFIHRPMYVLYRSERQQILVVSVHSAVIWIYPQSLDPRYHQLLSMFLLSDLAVLCVSYLGFDFYVRQVTGMEGASVCVDRDTLDVWWLALNSKKLHKVPFLNSSLSPSHISIQKRHGHVDLVVAHWDSLFLVRGH